MNFIEMIYSRVFLVINVLLVLVAALLAQSGYAYDPNDVTDQLQKKPSAIEGVGIQEKLSEQIDLSLEFTNDQGLPVTLGQYFDNTRPVIFSMVYYNCPSLCNFHLNGLTKALKKLDLSVGNDIQLVALSMDHRETPSVSGPKKQSYLEEYGRNGADRGWHFLTGSEENIEKITKQIGFGFKWLPEQQEFAHASAAIVMTPGGQISRYLHGVEFVPNTLKLALLEASKGKIGSVVDQVLMFCFRFDPRKNKYTLYAYNIMRLGGTLTVIVMAIFLGPIWLRERRKKKA